MKYSKLGLVPVILVALNPGLAAATDDAPPSTPTNVTAELYAGAGGEIFWNRSTDDVAVRGYEIIKNGQNLGERDALSFYDPSLDANTRYTFNVTAIDLAGQRSGTVSVTVGGGTTTPPQIEAPAAPTDLRGTVYSSTSAELFWARAAASNLNYEVSLDGTVVATTNGTSYFTDALSAGLSYRYQVIAIDSEGRRSTASSVTLSTSSSGGGPTPITPPTDTLAQIRPQNLSIEIYSSTAAELFWTPAGAVRPVIQRNEIRRNGVLIDTLQGEFLRSYFDDTREPGTDYTYQVTAISSAGMASATVSDTGETPPQPGPTPVSPITDLPEAIQVKLDTAFDIVNGVAVEQVMATIARLADRDIRGELGLELVESGINADGNPVETYSCPVGGELLDTQNLETIPGFISQFEAIDCAIGPVVFSANALITATTLTGDFQSLGFAASDIELVDARDLSTISSASMSLILDPSDSRSSLWGVGELSVDREQGSYSADSFFGYGNNPQNALPDGTLGLTLTVRALEGPFDDIGSVTTLGPMVYANGRENAHPSEGRIMVGSTTDNLLIDAFTDSADTFNLTVTNDGSTTIFSVPFSDTRQIEVPLLDGVDAGF